jgi:signal transduction histidine kinase
LKDGRKKGISQLFDMNRVLYAAGDCKSLLKLSLELALIQSRLNSGFILYWGQKSPELILYWAKDLKQNQFVEEIIKSDQLQSDQSLQIKDIMQIKNPVDHPVFTSLGSLLSGSLIGENITKLGGETILIPLKKTEDTTGIMVLQRIIGDQELSEEDLKLLAFLGIQTAISMENLSLLRESEKSYKELQNLQDQIISMEKMATQGRISSEIGHELNNYLTVIMGNFQILNMKINQGESASLNKHIVTITANLEKIKRFAEGLLDFSTLKVEKTECDLNDLIEKTISFIKPQNIFKNISLVTQLEPHLPLPVMDSGQIQQVLYNLLNNAADAMGKRKGEGGIITVGTNHYPQEKSVEVWIKDQGKGISQEELKKLFTRGFTTKESGHGIGLSICKSIIEQHHGTIQVESRLNEGSTFRIKLPLNQEGSS